jgi:CRP-like cAMP-binding protein
MSALTELWSSLKGTRGAGLIDAQALRAFSIFSDLSRQQAEKLHHHLHERRFQAGEVIFDRGQNGHALYLIRAGDVAVQYWNGTADQEVARLGPGDFFGEVALLCDEVGRTAKVVALTECRCIALFRESLNHISARDPALGILIYRELSSALAQRLSNLAKSIDGEMKVTGAPAT